MRKLLQNAIGLHFVKPFSNCNNLLQNVQQKNANYLHFKLGHFITKCVRLLQNVVFLHNVVKFDHILADCYIMRHYYKNMALHNLTKTSRLLRMLMHTCTQRQTSTIVWHRIFWGGLTEAKKTKQKTPIMKVFGRFAHSLLF